MCVGLLFIFNSGSCCLALVGLCGAYECMESFKMCHKLYIDVSVICRDITRAFVTASIRTKEPGSL